MSNLTSEEIKYIAMLAKLQLTEKEIEKFKTEFNNILDYVSLIKECNTEGIEFEHHLSDFVGDILMEDVPVASMPQEEILKNATYGRSEDGFIKTSKIVSKDLED